jgi:thiol-disulfide isomerase/thioredoxin
LILVVLALFPVLATAGEFSESADGPQLRLSLPDLTGQRRGLEEFAGKVLLVNFWASWCTPCITEMPSIQRLAKQMADKPFAVIAVNVGESQRRAQVTAERLGLEFPVLLDKDSAVFNGWGATVLPTTYLLDPTGRMRYIGRGPLEWDGVEAVTLIEGLMSEAEEPRP